MLATPIIITIFLVAIAYAIFFFTRPKTVRICFVGPHSTGKTVSLLSLLDLNNKTVTTLSNHRILYKNKEIFELVPDESSEDFTRRFHINPDDKFVFFLKNEEELEAFPDCTPFDVTFVLWKKSEEKCKDVLYLQESSDKLKELISKL